VGVAPRAEVFVDPALVTDPAALATTLADLLTDDPARIQGAIGAAGGAVRGSPGTGAAVGAATGTTAGFLRGLFKAGEPSPVYKNFVNHCLRERGYEPVGWQ